MIFPQSTIGIIGGGQLAKMMALAAKQMGYKVIALDPSENCCAKSVVDELIVANYSDEEAIKNLADKSDVLTYEFENVDYSLIYQLEKDYNIPQGSKALLICQHRLFEKEFANENLILTPKFKRVSNTEQLAAALKEIAFPAILKTCRLGYDGKGQITINNIDDIKKKDVLNIIDQDAILEEMINFDKEISVIVTKGYNECVVFPIGENIHHNKILKYSVVPADIKKILKEKASQIAITLLEKLNYVGTLAVEFFIKDDEIYFNELAPRPHNSGHYSIEGCNKSQFDTHIKAICGLHLGDVKLLQETTMLNILGQDYDKLLEYLKFMGDCYLHIYGKDENKINRKVGHVTFTGKNAFKKAKQLGEKNEY